MNVNFATSTFFLISKLVFIASLVTACSDNNPSSDDTVNYLIDDNLHSADATIWQASDGWSNGLPFLNGWCAESIIQDSNGMSLTLDAQLCSEKFYMSGEYRTKGFYGYGRAEVEMKVASGAGIVSSIFFYTGVTDDGNEHEEIDIEILGEDTSRVQVNYWTEESGIEQEHPTFIDLGFDASTDFHLYAIDWQEDAIRWYVDNTLIHTETGSNGKLPVLDMRIFMNLWACDAAVWCGVFDDVTLPVQTKYRNFRFVEYP